MAKTSLFYIINVMAQDDLATTKNHETDIHILATYTLNIASALRL